MKQLYKFEKIIVENASTEDKVKLLNEGWEFVHYNLFGNAVFERMIEDVNGKIER